MLNALTEGERLKLDTVQVFTKNQQQWKAKPLDESLVRDWRAEVARLGWDKGGPTDAKGGRGRIATHASYLINLASCIDELFTKSVDGMTEEVERCETLGIPFLVHHPGSFTGWTLEQGIKRIIEAYGEVFRRTRGFATVMCFEGTVGSGSLIGGRFEHLAALRHGVIERTGEDTRVGYCLDTCHMHAAGYDMSTVKSANAALDDFDRVCGLSNLKVFHINDSKGAAGSKLDRHEHIGEGTIGVSTRKLSGSGFAAVVNRAELRTVPKILETPKGQNEAGKNLDSVNLARLRRLIK